MSRPDIATVPHSPALQATTHYLDAAEVRFAFRRLEPKTGVPLVLLHRFRATMDDWDPTFLDALATERDVVIFDNRGVGRSSGTAPDSAAAMAADAAAFIRALGLEQVDILGWSMGGMVAQQLALAEPKIVRRLVLAGTAPGGVPDAPPPPDKVRVVATKPVNDSEDFLYLFFPETPEGRRVGLAHLARLGIRSEPKSPPVKPESFMRQGAAVRAWSMGEGSAYPRLGELTQPALIANGHHDVMIHAFNSYAMARRIPDARLILYPGAGHGFLFQDGLGFADEVVKFLH